MPKALKAELERQFKVLSQRWDEGDKSLPLPRIEVEFTPNGPSETNCVARLVTGHLKCQEVGSVILWRTAAFRDSSPITDGVLDPKHIPHFFGCDVAYLIGHLNCPAYVVGVKDGPVRWDPSKSHPHQISRGSEDRRTL